MTPTIRPLGPDDLEKVRDILAATDLFPAEMLADMVEGYLTRTTTDKWLVAEIQGAVAAFAYAEPERMTNGTYNILAIATHPDHQKKGVATGLIRQMEDTLRRMGCRITLIETIDQEDFAPQRRLYRALNYVETGHIPDFYDVGYGKVTFAKRLQPKEACKW